MSSATEPMALSTNECRSGRRPLVRLRGDPHARDRQLDVERIDVGRGKAVHGGVQGDIRVASIGASEPSLIVRLRRVGLTAGLSGLQRSYVHDHRPRQWQKRHY
jgi:hypothetical protein